MYPFPSRQGGKSGSLMVLLWLTGPSSPGQLSLYILSPAYKSEKNKQKMYGSGGLKVYKTKVLMENSNTPRP